MRLRCAGLLLLAVTTLGAGAAGEKVAVVTLRSLDGREVSSETHAGKPRVYVFFTTWSEESTKLLKGLAEAEKALRAKGVAFVGISLDVAGAQAVSAYAKKEGIAFPILLGAQGASKAFDVKEFPTTLVIDAGGTIRARFDGPTPAKTIEDAARAAAS